MEEKDKNDNVERGALDGVLNLSIKQIEEEEHSLDIKRALLGHLLPLVELWSRELKENHESETNRRHLSGVNNNEDDPTGNKDAIQIETRGASGLLDHDILLKVADLDENVLEKGTEEELGEDISSKLQEPKVDLIVGVVAVIGRDAAVDLFKKTQKVESDGGMMIRDGTRRRTTGGTFLQLLRENANLDQKDIAALFNRFNDHQQIKTQPRKNTEIKDVQVFNYEKSFSPSTGLYCFEAIGPVRSYQFIVGDIGAISRVISPLVSEIIIMNKVRKQGRSTMQIGVVVEGAKQLEAAIGHANGVLGNQKGFEFSPIDNSKDIFSVQGKKEEIDRVDANGMYQLQVNFVFDDIKKEDKTRAAKDMRKRLERFMERSFVEKVCHGPGEEMLLFSHISDIVAAKKKLESSQEFRVAPSKRVWKPFKKEVTEVSEPLKMEVTEVSEPPKREVPDPLCETKTVVSLLVKSLKGKRKCPRVEDIRKGPTVEDITNMFVAEAKDISCYERRIDMTFDDADLAKAVFEKVQKIENVVQSAVMISQKDLGNQYAPLMTEKEMMKLIEECRFDGAFFNTAEEIKVSNEDGNLFFTFKSVDAANQFMMIKSKNKLSLNSLGQLKQTREKDNYYILEADKDGFYLLQGGLKQFYSGMLQDFNFEEFKVTSDHQKIFISLNNKGKMFKFLFSLPGRKLDLRIDQKHFVKKQVPGNSEKSDSINVVQTIVQDIIEATLFGKVEERDEGRMDEESTKEQKSDQSQLLTIVQDITEAAFFGKVEGRDEERMDEESSKKQKSNQNQVSQDHENMIDRIQAERSGNLMISSGMEEAQKEGQMAEAVSSNVNTEPNSEEIGKKVEGESHEESKRLDSACSSNKNVLDSEHFLGRNPTRKSRGKGKRSRRK